MKEEICKNCQQFDKSISNPNVGDCRCVVSKFYGDVMSITDTCEQFFGKDEKDERNKSKKR